MMHIIEQTRDEKIAMYMKLTKRELSEMLINCNDALKMLPQQARWAEVSPSPSAGGTVTIGPLPTIWATTNN